MTMLTAAWRPVLFLFLAMALTGCFQFSNDSLEEEKDPHFIEGKKRVNSMDYDGAIESFEKALQTNPNNSAAHLDLGILYDRRKNDYAAAIYHYQRHLKLRPNSPMGEVVNQNIIACKRELAKSVAFVVGTRDIQREFDRLSSTNNLLKQEIERLQTELARKPLVVTNFLTVTQMVAAPVPSETPRIVAEAKPEPRNPLERTVRPQVNSQNGEWVPQRITPRGEPARQARVVHTLRSGETIASLARRYNVSMEAIIAANPGMNPNRVRSGQKINIPSR